MEIQKIINKKIQRKKFFISLGTGFAGFMLLKSFPFSFFNKNSNSLKENREINIKINPLAVRRNKIGGNNG